MNKWFTRYLFEIENGVEQDPKAWIVREGDDRLSPTPYADYPNPQAEDVVLHLTKGGNTQGGLTTDKGSRKKEMLIDNVAFAGEYLARVKNSPNRLLYTTPILSEGLHISGTASITLSLSSSVPAANLSVWLVSLPWNDQDEATIYDNIITRGWADPQNHESIYTSQPLEPGVFYDLTFELQPDDQIIPAGQQIGLMIFSSDQEFTLHPKPGTELKIDLKGSSLTLPIVGGLSEFENAVK